MKKLTIILSILIFSINAYSQRKIENEFVFNESIQIINYTDLKFDKYSKIILNEILNMDSITVVFYTMFKELKSDDIEIRGYIRKAPGKNIYSIFVTKYFRNYYLKSFLAHELVHLKQLHDGKLYYINSKTIVWDNDTIKLNEFEYFDRPNEREAFKIGRDVKKELRELLYITN